MSDAGKGQTSSGKDRRRQPSRSPRCLLRETHPTHSLWLEVWPFPEYRLLLIQVFPYVELYQKVSDCFTPFTSEIRIRQPEEARNHVGSPAPASPNTGSRWVLLLCKPTGPAPFSLWKRCHHPCMYILGIQGWAFSKDRSASASSHKADQRGPSNEGEFSPKQIRR